MAHTVFRGSRAIALLALPLDRPQPIGFVLVGIVGGRRRDQSRALFAKVIEATAHSLALHRVHVEGVVRYGRREVLKHRSKPDGRSEVAACSGLRRARHRFFEDFIRASLNCAL